MSKLITKHTHPYILEAMWLINCDNGGHLIGTVYPGEKLNGDYAEIPWRWRHLLDAAEAGLKRLRTQDGENWGHFCCGAEDEVEDLMTERGDLAEAHQLLTDWFMGWPPLITLPRLPTVKITMLFAWYDLWIGAYWDRERRKLYILPVPCIGVVLEFGR